MANQIYNSASPYFETKISEDLYLDIMVDRPIPRLESDRIFTITQVYNMRPDLLAYDLYKRSDLWWVFAQRNPNTLKDPLGDFVTGTQIYIPQFSTLQTALGI